jgi:dUTP pyrophosphatase
MNVEIVNKSPFSNPVYATKGSSAVDLQADLSGDLWKIKGLNFGVDSANQAVVIYKRGRCLIPTGLYPAYISIEHELQVRPRSGLALKHGITVLNSPGTIDSDYRGEIGVLLINHGNSDFEIKHGDRIAQLVLSKVDKLNWVNTDIVNETTRGAGGFGHTGV